ncbi:tetratricopeptide repeat protein [Elioraea sp.]|uniref:tetratricopeptide repeat protein n=1 Tax=Elioraea sp. TaxID=2185103 RepID=UPI003F72D4B8
MARTNVMPGPARPAGPGDSDLADIFDEIEEDLRKERAKRLWDRYGWIVLLVAGGVVLGVAGWRGWQWYEHRQATEAAERFLAAASAADRGEAASAAATFAELSRGAPAGYRVFARLREAGARARLGETAEAVALYETLARDAAVPPLYRDLATLLAVMHQTDSGDPRALADRLAPLAAEGAAFRFSAMELQAVLAERRGDRAEARRLLQALAQDGAAPEGVRRRAGEMLGAIGS